MITPDHYEQIQALILGVLDARPELRTVARTLGKLARDCADTVYPPDQAAGVMEQLQRIWGEKDLHHADTLQKVSAIIFPLKLLGHTDLLYAADLGEYEGFYINDTDLMRARDSLQQYYESALREPYRLSLPPRTLHPKIEAGETEQEILARYLAAQPPTVRGGLDWMLPLMPVANGRNNQRPPRLMCTNSALLSLPHPEQSGATENTLILGLGLTSVGSLVSHLAGVSVPYLALSDKSGSTGQIPLDVGKRHTHHVLAVNKVELLVQQKQLFAIPGPAEPLYAAAAIAEHVARNARSPFGQTLIRIPFDPIERLLPKYQMSSESLRSPRSYPVNRIVILYPRKQFLLTDGPMPKSYEKLTSTLMTAIEKLSGVSRPDLRETLQNITNWPQNLIRRSKQLTLPRHTSETDHLYHKAADRVCSIEPPAIVPSRIELSYGLDRKVTIICRGERLMIGDEDPVYSYLTWLLQTIVKRSKGGNNEPQI